MTGHVAHTLDGAIPAGDAMRWTPDPETVIETRRTAYVQALRAAARELPGDAKRVMLEQAEAIEGDA